MVTPLINETNISSAKTAYELITAINQASGLFFISAVLLVLYVIAFIAFKRGGARIIMTGLSFIMVILFTVAWFLQWINGLIVVVPVIGLIFSIIGIYLFQD